MSFFITKPFPIKNEWLVKFNKLISKCGIYLMVDIILSPLKDRECFVNGNEASERFTGLYPFCSLSATKMGITGVLSNLFFSSAHSYLLKLTKYTWKSEEFVKRILK